METKVNYVCPLCGSGNVWEMFWVSPNTMEISNYVDVPDNGYCNDCDKKVNVIFADEYKPM